MNEQQQEQIYGRSMSVGAYGDNIESLELAALDEARKFFGPEARLEVVRNYSAATDKGAEPGKRYWAMISIREIP